MMGVSYRRTKMAGPLLVLIPDQNRGAMRVGQAPQAQAKKRCLNAVARD